jgi:hypothetical protein
MGTDTLNSHFLRPSPTRSRDVSGDSQSALVDKLGVSPIRSRLLTGSHRYHPGIVQQAQGRSAETAVSPHNNNQSTVYQWTKKVRLCVLVFLSVNMVKITLRLWVEVTKMKAEISGHNYLRRNIRGRTE